MPALVETKYESDQGTIHRFLLTPNYAAAAGTPPTGAVDSDIRPKVSKANNEFGIRPRGVRLSRIIGTAPDTCRKYAFLSVLTAIEWNSTAFNPGASVTIGTDTYTIVVRVPEDY